MKIAVNTRFLLPGRLEGIGWFTYHTLKILTAKYPDVKFTFLFDRSWDEKFIFSDNVTPVKLFPPARHPVLWYWYFEYSVNAYLNRNPHSLFLSTDGFLSLRHDATPQVAVIHDLNFEHYPEFLPPLVRKYYRYFFPKYAHKASAIATVSEYSRSDISEQYNIPKEKTHVVYNGASEIFKRVDSATKTTVRNSLTGGYPYFLFIGAFNPRKNIVGLFRSFDLFCEKYGTEHRLVVVGERMHWTAEMEEVYSRMNFQSRVIFTGRKQDEELNSILASADVLWFVSHFEGFGIPIVEAFRAGVPVLTSATTALQEIGQDAALYCNPKDYEHIAQSMHAIVTSSELRNSLINKGLERAARFTWEHTANALWQVLLSAIHP
ncbi:MAG: glycosyltransferase family 4 protein [Thermaurantimonas sp.]